MANNETNFQFDTSLISKYRSNSQKIRVMSENWFHSNMYCPNCGSYKIIHLTNNAPVADFQCCECGSIYELKSKNGELGNKIPDGAYSTMINRITSYSNPDLFILQYTNNYTVTAITLIPKYFFIPDIIEKRNPLPSTAKRSGWVGYNILYGNIPDQGKISIVRESRFTDIGLVIDHYNRIKNLEIHSLEARGWLIDILQCVNRINTQFFELKDVYDFADELAEKYSNNKNIKPKIRQQLQLLRDRGFIEFLGNGHYKKIVYT